MTDLFTYTPRMMTNRLLATVELLKRIPEFAESKGMTEAEVLDARLAPDMFNLKKQVQVMTDNAKAFAARLNEIENPKWEDTEETIEQLIERLQRAVEFLKANPIADEAKAQQVKITFPWAPGMYLSAEDYVVEYLIPNFHFHATVFYAILRNLGMQIGKQDFTLGLSMKPLE